MPDRVVGSYIMLAATRAGVPLVLPQHTNPITGATVPEVTLYDGLPLEQAVPLLRSVDGQRILFGGEWTGGQMFGLAILSHQDGTGSTVLAYDEVRALLQTPAWHGSAE